jgi:HK97 family phage major capsid protein
MSLVSTSNLRSEDFYRQLVVPALSEKSVVLLNLRVISTLSTKVNLPIVNDASVGWVAEGAALPDAALNPQLVVVTPRKLSAYSDLSNESLDDAGSSEIVGAAMAATLARKVDASFFVSGGANAPLALDPAAVLTVDAAPTAGIDACIHACAQMEADSASPSVVFLNPLDWAALAKLKESAGSAKPVLVTQTGLPLPQLDRSMAFRSRSAAASRRARRTSSTATAPWQSCARTGLSRLIEASASALT